MAIRGWTVAQRFAIGVAAFTVITGTVGLILNPDFSVGDDATAEVFIVDWNGWHAVAALAVGLPGLAVAWLPHLAVPYLLYRVVVDAGTGIWAALDDRPLGLLYLPTASDAILHMVIAAVCLVGVMAARLTARPTVRQA